MKRHSFIAMSAVFFAAQITLVNAQTKSEEKLNPIVQNFVNEANNNSQLQPDLSGAHFLQGKSDGKNSRNIVLKTREMSDQIIIQK